MTTFKPWEYRAEAGFVKGTELTGYNVVAVDGDLGQVIEAEYDGPRPAHLYVDVGSWLFGHHVMLPVGVVERIDATERKVYVDRTKDQIEHAPRVDPAPEVTDYVNYFRTWPVTTPARTCRRMASCDLSLSDVGEVKLIPPMSATGVGAFWLQSQYRAQI